MIDITNILIQKIFVLLTIIIALPAHELAHGYVSYWFGDPTAKINGRLTLNPVKHIDPIGFILILVVGFGFAKPVPINTAYYKNKRLGMFCTSVAGAVVNIILAFIGFVIWNIMDKNMTGFMETLITFISYFVLINISLAIFNLIPIPPLDGSKALASLLPNKYGFYLSRFERYGFYLVIILAFTGILSPVILGGREIVINFFEFVYSGITLLF